ncbi:IclR helix-turn-helix domain-containing protein [Lentzea fradiae]|uniref:IclR helix-turn-helix domain-containing protein n=1 Tax=Lentzea fradiae TaxID=200378 RepID=A0A1G7TS95_9PSEU|nr:helix-turn-helix domain-containing protein [Lentzea fradiae]SDG38052.1 IclR helix-turn-helix domain-containing protein [Lentzea fradiae]
MNISSSELLRQALDSLRELLGPGWQVQEFPEAEDGTAGDAVADSRVQLTPPDQQRFAELLVIAQTTVTPQYADTQLRQIGTILRQARAAQSLLVISPWINAQAQQVLHKHGISYLDLTGNVSISIEHPSVRIETRGAAKSPRAPSESRTVTLSGVRAGRVIRFLADHRPPYRASQIASATNVSLPWVSRLLGQLEDQLLIRRRKRTIVDVKWPEILRARANTYDLLRHNSYVSAIALNGETAVLDDLAQQLQNDDALGKITVTGHYAARLVAPYATGGQLMLYVEAGPHSPDAWANRLGLMRADGGNVLLLRAHDDVVFDRTRTVGGVPHVALSQLVLDSLAGPGRLPAEGEKVLDHMVEHQHEWRLPGPSDRD